MESLGSPTTPDFTGDVLYEQDGVLLSLKDVGDQAANLILGRLRIMKEKFGTFIVWLSDESKTNSFLPPSAERDWAIVDAKQGAVSYSQANGNGTQARPIRFEVNDLKCLQIASIGEESQRRKQSLSPDPERTCSITFVLADGTTNPALIFPGDSAADLLNALKMHLNLRRSRQDDGLILCETRQKRYNQDRTLAELRLFPERYPQLGYLGGQLGTITHGAESVFRFVSDLRRDPYAATMTAFSKISDYLLYDETTSGSHPSEELAELLHQSLGSEGPRPKSLERTIPSSSEPNEAEMAATLFGSSDSSVEGYEVINPPVADLVPRPHLERSSPLTEAAWIASFDEEGRVRSEMDVKYKIFRGGVDSDLRKEVWKYLLGYNKWDSTHAERKEHREKLVEEYYRMKLQWKSMSADQEARFSAFRARKDLIEKDVNRTDRTLNYYAGDSNKNVEILRDVLMTYMMYDFDLGYVQGMSDLLAPILYVVQNEVDAFWCFVGCMERTKSNFELDQNGIKQQLSQLRTLLHTVDPHLATYLDARDSGNLFFCFRWLLVLFKREFTYPQIMKLWEVLWTNGPFWKDPKRSQELQESTNFHLIIALSILDSQRNTVLENRFGFTEILKHVNDLALSIDVEEVLTKAEAIFLQLKDSPSVSGETRQILGLPFENDFVQ